MFNLFKKYYFIFIIIILIFSQKVQALIIPNDPDLSKLTYLNQIAAFDAWEKTTGSEEVIVAVIDSGVDIDHPDLKGNIWTNPLEIPNDNLDNDKNGYIDDRQGWDFITNTPDPRPKIINSYSPTGISHGTFIAGIIAAKGNNNQGITGISWHSKIMPLRVLDSEGSGNPEDIVKAIDYAVKNGADILNFSLTSPVADPALELAIDNAYQQGRIIIAAAGNEAILFAGVDFGYNLDFTSFYPVCHDGDNNQVIGVAAVDENDIKSLFSNYGNSCVDLSAPGENFYGLNYYNPIFPEFRNYYLTGWSGTSMSAPLVSGAAALVKSIRPELAVSQVYDLLINSGDSINLKNLFYFNQLGKRLNIKKLLDQALATISTVNRKIVVAAAKNNLPTVAIYDLDGSKKEEFYAYSQKFTGGVNLTVGNVKSDWPEEIITAAGSGGGPHLRIFNQQGQLISQFFAYPANFSGGVNIVTIKYNSESEEKIITAPQSNYPPLIKIFDYHGNLLKEFLVFENNYQQGVNLASGDINGDGIEEIIVSKANHGSLVRIFTSTGNLLSQFEAFGSAVNGLNLTSADIDNDQIEEIIVAPVNNAKGQVKIFDYRGNLKSQFLAFENNYFGGINLTASDIDLDQEVEILATPNNNHSPMVKVYSPSGNLKMSIPVFSPIFNQGIKVSSINY